MDRPVVEGAGICDRTGMNARSRRYVAGGQLPPTPATFLLVDFLTESTTSPIASQKFSLRNWALDQRT